MPEQIKHISPTKSESVSSGLVTIEQLVARCTPILRMMVPASRGWVTGYPESVVGDILTAAGVPALLDVAEAAQEFAKKHTSFHPDHWIAGGAWIDGRKQYCDACDLCAAIAALNEIPKGE